MAVRPAGDRRGGLAGHRPGPGRRNAGPRVTPAAAGDRRKRISCFRTATPGSTRRSAHGRSSGCDRAARARANRHRRVRFRHQSRGMHKIVRLCHCPMRRRQTLTHAASHLRRQHPRSYQVICPRSAPGSRRGAWPRDHHTRTRLRRVTVTGSRRAAARLVIFATAKGLFPRTSWTSLDLLHPLRTPAASRTSPEGTHGVSRAVKSSTADPPITVVGGPDPITVVGGPDPIEAALFVVPTPPRGAVRRTRLEERLDAGVRGPLTLVTAPAGTGKTVLVSSWVRRRADRSTVVWLSLDDSTIGTAMFWHLVVTGLARHGVDVPPALSQGPLTADPSFTSSIAARILAHEHPIILVLDCDGVLPAEVAARLNSLIRRSGGGLRVVLLTREDPLAPLAPLPA